MDHPHEEYRPIAQPTSWLLVVLLCLTILAWGYATYRMVPDTPRQWNLGNLPDVPGESIYSTAGPTTGPAQRQLAPLPRPSP